MTASTHAPPASRLYFLDALRIAAFALLVLYHVGMYYVSWPWHVKSALASTTLEPWMRLSSPWRLSLLFLLSGVATSYMLRRDGASGALLRARSLRLFLPVLLGMVIVVPPQAYFEVRQFHAYHGSFVDFMRLYFASYGGFCTADRGCLQLPTWNHLWFVVYLLVYTVGLWLLVRLWPALPAQAGAALWRALAGARLWWLPVSVLAALRIALLDRYPPTHALVNDAYLHACYFGLFCIGAAMARVNAPWPRIERVRWISLALALAGWLAMVAFPWLDAMWGMAMARAAARTGFATMQWCGVLAALGFAHRHWNRDFAWRATLTEAVFPVYLVHQTLIIGLAVALAPLAWPMSLEGPLLVAGTFALSFGCYAIVRHVAPLRPWFGLARRRALPATLTAAPEALR
ncbi:MAG: acyltransferase family protein [Burkholderiaceae bacterium]